MRIQNRSLPQDVRRGSRSRSRSPGPLAGATASALAAAVAASALAALAASGCDDRAARSAAAQQAPPRSAETRPPNAPHQRPAFPGQTRAPLRSEHRAIDATTIVSGLEHPWSLAFLPDGQMLVTERPGRMRIVSADGAKSPPVAGLPAVDARDQGGLLDVALDPAFPRNGLIYWSYAEPREAGRNGTTVARARLDRSTSPPRLRDVQVIWRQQPAWASTKHFGSRLVFAPDGTLFITTGERFEPTSRGLAQRLDNTLGKVIRIRPDGSIPSDNPFVNRPDAKPEIYSYGHRNIQAAAIHPTTGKLWVVEHGAKGGDEINVIEPGKNYGWPVIAYGIDYSGAPIGQGITAAPGMVQPIYYWDPSIAPSGMAFYTSERFAPWRGSLFVGALAAKLVARLTLHDERVTGEERLLEGRARIRDVRLGPDGALYILTDEEAGEMLKLEPAERPAAPQTGAAERPATSPAAR